MIRNLVTFLGIVFAKNPTVTLNDGYTLRGQNDAPYIGNILSYWKNEGVSDQALDEFSWENKADFNNVSIYRGIPFADPPKRFERASRFSNSNNFYENSEPKNMFRSSKTCPQGNNPAKYSEDCLYLDIYAPISQKQNIPVYIWIHGGGYDSGSGDIYDARYLSAAHEAIIVTINYRLNIFGFFEPNLGLYDQRLAIEWVAEEIANFGGDPDNISIFGQSAGGASVSQQLTFDALRVNGMVGSGVFGGKQAKPLFRQAVLMSGTNNLPWATQWAGRQNVVLEKIHHELCLIDENYKAAHQMAAKESITLKLLEFSTEDLMTLKNRVFESSKSNSGLFSLFTPLETGFIPSYKELYEEENDYEEQLFNEKPFLKANFSGYEIKISTQQLEFGYLQKIFYKNKYSDQYKFDEENTLSRFINDDVYLTATSLEFSEKNCYVTAKKENASPENCLENLISRQKDELYRNWAEDFQLSNIAGTWREQYQEILFGAYENSTFEYDYQKGSASFEDWQNAAYETDFSFVSDSLMTYQRAMNQNAEKVSYFQNQHYQIIWDSIKNPLLNEKNKFKSAIHSDDLLTAFGSYFCSNNNQTSDAKLWQNGKTCTENRSLTSKNDVTLSFVNTQFIFGQPRTIDSNTEDTVRAMIFRDGQVVYEKDFLAEQREFQNSVVNPHLNSYPYHREDDQSASTLQFILMPLILMSLIIL